MRGLGVCPFLFTGLPLQHLSRQRTRQLEKVALGVHCLLGRIFVPVQSQLEHTRGRLVKPAVQIEACAPVGGVSDRGVRAGVQELPEGALTILCDGGNREFTATGFDGGMKSSLP